LQAIPVAGIPVAGIPVAGTPVAGTSTARDQRVAAVGVVVGSASSA
jgi:hypothetical protein